jgi:hypothetical protein
MQVIAHPCSCTQLATRAPLCFLAFAAPSIDPFAMAVKCSSGANSAMKASLVLMLLFGAVVAAHGRQVAIDNQTCKLLTVNGVVLNATLSVLVNVALDGLLHIGVLDSAGNIVKGVVPIPECVDEVTLKYVGGHGILVTVTGVVGSILGLLGNLLNAILGTVLGVVGVALKCL